MASLKKSGSCLHDIKLPTICLQISMLFAIFAYYIVYKISSAEILLRKMYVY